MPAECQHPFDVSPSSESGGAPDAELSRIEGRRDGVRVVLAAVRMTAPLMLSTTLWAIVGWAIWRAADRPPSDSPQASAFAGQQQGGPGILARRLPPIRPMRRRKS
jgi:hypothetical protein